MRALAMCVILTIWASASPAAAEDLICWKPADDVEPRKALALQLQQEAIRTLAARREAYEQLKTPAQIAAYQQKLQGLFVEQLGGFPERSPLNAQTVGVLEADTYRIEKVIFESQPGHHVTANFYLPHGSGPFPAVLVSSGHSRTAKTAAYNQRFGIMLARHGMAALCYDPIGQGERSQMLTAEGRPQVESTTQEHFAVGIGSILVGSNTARYRIWDGIRAIDYVTSRPEIDARRIGFTGCSGGGTLTSYVMALDERVMCAAPACYLTTFQRLLETIGPQDAEQNIFAQLALGLDQPDYVLMRAPRPTLISATTGDFFDIQGTWDNFRQAKRIYTRLGYPERVDLVEAEGTHGVQPANLAAIAQWMRRWLLDQDQPVPIAELAVRDEAELLCTEQGQVLLLPGEKSVFDLNAEWAARLAEERKIAWQARPRDELLQDVRRAVGARRLSELPPPTWDKAGRVQRDGYHIDKLVLHTGSGVPLPALTFHPEEPQDDAYLYVHEGGKLADAAPGGPIEALVKEGYVVVAVDLRGQGETAAAGSSAVNDWKNFYTAYLLGKSFVGLHTEDILSAGHFVAYYQTKTPRHVHLVGVGQSGIAALHAAALEPELITSLTLRDTPADWNSSVGDHAHSVPLTSTVHGALRLYDLPELRATLGDRLR